MDVVIHTQTDRQSSIMIAKLHEIYQQTYLAIWLTREKSFCDVCDIIHKQVPVIHNSNVWAVLQRTVSTIIDA